MSSVTRKHTGPALAKLMPEPMSATGVHAPLLGAPALPLVLPAAPLSSLPPVLLLPAMLLPVPALVLPAADCPALANAPALAELPVLLPETPGVPPPPEKKSTELLLPQPTREVAAVPK